MLELCAAEKNWKGYLCDEIVKHVNTRMDHNRVVQNDHNRVGEEWDEKWEEAEAESKTSEWSLIVSQAIVQWQYDPFQLLCRDRASCGDRTSCGDCVTLQSYSVDVQIPLNCPVAIQMCSTAVTTCVVESLVSTKRNPNEIVLTNAYSQLSQLVHCFLKFEK